MAPPKRKAHRFLPPPFAAAQAHRSDAPPRPHVPVFASLASPMRMHHPSQAPPHVFSLNARAHRSDVPLRSYVGALRASLVRMRMSSRSSAPPVRGSHPLSACACAPLLSQSGVLARLRGCACLPRFRYRPAPLPRSTPTRRRSNCSAQAQQLQRACVAAGGRGRPGDSRLRLARRRAHGACAEASERVRLAPGTPAQ